MKINSNGKAKSVQVKSWQSKWNLFCERSKGRKIGKIKQKRKKQNTNERKKIMHNLKKNKEQEKGSVGLFCWTIIQNVPLL